MHAMDWDDYRYVLALSRAHTLSAAGKELRVARTTVGRRIAAIEKALGVPLFDQTADGFVATGAGEELAAVATRMEAEMLAAEGRVMGRDAQISGRLRVATMDFVFESFVDVFASFTERYPGIELTVCASYENVSLKRREADVAIRMSMAPSEYLVGRKLGMVEFALYANRELADDLAGVENLGEYPWLFSDDRVEDEDVEKWIQGFAAGAKPALRYDSYPVLRAAVCAGVGVSFLPTFDADRAPQLVALDWKLDEQARGLWCLTLPELRTNSRVRAFMDHVYETMSGRLPTDVES